MKTNTIIYNNEEITVNELFSRFYESSKLANKYMMDIKSTYKKNAGVIDNQTLSNLIKALDCCDSIRQTVQKAGLEVMYDNYIRIMRCKKHGY